MIVQIVDVETTGLNPDRNQILEIAAIRINPWRPEEIISHFHDVVRYEELVGHPAAFHINARLIEGMARNDGTHNTLKEAIQNLELWLDAMPLVDGEKLVMSGKNPGFDRAFLTAAGLDLNRWHHRMVDPAILFMAVGDKVPPALKECLTRAGLKGFTDTLHIATDDCWDIARLLWSYYCDVKVDLTFMDFLETQ